MLGFLKKMRAGHVPGTSLTEPGPILHGCPRPEAEIDFIMKLLEKKFSTPFKKRIKLDGYIEKPEYRLVIDNYGAAANGGNLISIYGGASENILDICSRFVEKYWADSEKYSHADVNAMDSFDRGIYDRWKRTEVAGSREELVLMMEVEGVA